MLIASRRRTVMATLLAALLVSSCASPADQARDSAERSAISIIEAVADEFRSQTSGLPVDTPAATVSESAHAVLFPGETLAVLSTSDSGPDAVITVMVKARAESGGGLSYEQYTARACGRLTIDPGPSGSVRASPVKCPALETTPWQGQVDGDASWQADYIAD